MKKELIFFLLIITPCFAADWVIDGNSVYVNDSNAYIMAAPHTLYSSGYVYFNVSSKVYTGDVDVVFGFNTSEVQPKRVELYNPRTVWWNETLTYHLINVSSVITTTEPCQVGNEYNAFKRNVTHDDIRGTTTNIVCFDSYTNEGNNYTVKFNKQKSKTEYWDDKSSSLNYFTYNFGGMNKWWYVQNVPIQSGKNYIFRGYVDIPVSSKRSDGKYWFAIKPSSESIGQAISNGHLYYLDPWWNASWSYCKNITINSTSSVTLTDFPVFLNVTYVGGGKMNSDWSDIRFVNDSCSGGSTATTLSHEFVENISTAGEFWVKIPSLPSYGINISMYYGNAGAADSSSTSTWNSAFDYVYHMNDNTTTETIDSTVNATYLNKVDGVNQPLEMVSRIFNGQNFTESNTEALNTSEVVQEVRTFEAWVYNDNDDPTWDMIYSMNRNGLYLSGTSMYVYHLFGNCGGFPASPVPYDTWTHVAWIQNGSHSLLYLNGVLNRVTGTGLNCYNPGTLTFTCLGAADIGVPLSTCNNYYFNGTMDEVRISSTNRSDEWLNMTVQIVVNQTNLVYFGSEETSGAGPVTYCGGAYTSGNWTVTGTTYCADEIIPITGNVSVENGGLFMLDNITLNMTLSSDGLYNITVKDGGRLEIGNGTEIQSNDTSFEYLININDGAEFEMNDSVITDAGWNAANPGLIIEADYANITNSNFTLCYNCINFQDSEYGIVNTSILHDCTNDGINLLRSNNTEMFNNTLYNHGNNAIYMLTTSNSNTIEQNYIHANTLNGVEIDNSESNTVYNNIMYMNAQHNMHLSGSDWNNITSNMLHNMTSYGLYLQTSDNNTVHLNDIKNGTYGIYCTGYDNNITFNSVYNTSTYGMFLTGAQYSEIVNNTVYDNAFYTVVMLNSGYSIIENNTLRNGSSELLAISTSDYVNITENSISNATIMGIDLDDSNYVRIYNNTIFDNADDGIDMYSSNHSTVTWNNITNNSNEGIDFRDCEYGTFINNTIFNNSGAGIDVESSNYTDMSYNNITWNYQGVVESGCTSNNVTYNTLRNNTYYGILLAANANSGIQQYNNISGSLVGFMVYISDSNNATYNNIFNNTWGLWVNETSTNNIFLYLTIYNNTYGLNVSGANISNHYFANSTISNSSVYEVSLDSNSQTTLLNVTFNKTNTSVIDTSVLTLRWYVDVQTVYPTYNPFPSALVRVYNVTGIQLNWYISDSSGYIPRQTIVEYERHAAGVNDWNNHTFTGEFQTNFGSNSTNITTNDIDTVFIVMIPGGGAAGGTGTWHPTEDMLTGPRCGNGVIDTGEDCINCPYDIEAVRGEGYCKVVYVGGWPNWWIFLLIGAITYGTYRVMEGPRKKRKERVQLLRRAHKMNKSSTGTGRVRRNRRSFRYGRRYRRQPVRRWGK